MSIKKVDESISELIRSSVIIVNVVEIVKELLENSIVLQTSNLTIQLIEIENINRYWRCSK